MASAGLILLMMNAGAALPIIAMLSAAMAPKANIFNPTEALMLLTV